MEDLIFRVVFFSFQFTLIRGFLFFKKRECSKYSVSSFPSKTLKSMAAPLILKISNLAKFSFILATNLTVMLFKQIQTYVCS